jgi:hypothetical protein
MPRRHHQQPRRQHDPLPVACARLDDAVNDLAHTRRHTIRLEGGRLRRVKLLSRYDELSQAVEMRRAGNGGQFNGQVPFWIDALLLRNHIDAEVVKMHEAPNKWPGWTVPRLLALVQHPWRPQDCKTIHSHANLLCSFSKRIDTLFAPKPVCLPDPCPECGVAVVYRKGDEDDKPIRTAALQISTDVGAICGNCRTRWAPDQLAMLGRLLNYKDPATA